MKLNRPLAKRWPIYTLIAIGAIVVILVVVITPVLVLRRDHERDHQQAIEEAKRTPSNQSKARVNLGYAQYQGSLVGSDSGVAQYLGMRYAAPPTGERRWRAPVEPEMDNSGDQVADTFGPICLGISETYPDNGAEDEDCLYVNVWAPANATSDSKLPVWLFIQGGGYTKNSNANWNGTTVVERSNRQIVFVNFNYRVGLWGFLASDRVRANGDLNVGLSDQRQVMYWIKQHISQFGGDPDHIVITGASAGAGSVALHMLISHASNKPEDRNLFVGAVGESVFLPAHPRVADLEWQYDRVLSSTSCNSSTAEDSLSCLRSLSTETLQNTANIPSPFPNRAGLPLFYWTPTIDGTLLTDSPTTLFSRGAFTPVPMIMGSTTNEGTVFASNCNSSTDFSSFIQDNYPLLTPTQATTITTTYPENISTPLPLHGPWFPAAASAYGEVTFICPAGLVLDSYVLQQNSSSYSSTSNNTTTTPQAWSYHYDVFDASNSASGLGVPHIWESWAVFGPDSISGIGGGPASYYTSGSDGAAAVVTPVMDYWISFVIHLDPSVGRTDGAPVWEAWGSSDGSATSGNSTEGGGKRLLIQEGGNFTMETVPLEQRQRCEFWKDLAPALEQKRI
ncbi:alpha/beta-hydrolase [Hypoxylon trugodes]|uniref:alpha/beta-hydrolase n=1 Tax=Hypoxylon trugodes TaxID=326681 RepID=UPI00218DC591|nr:alpha/beta-hydrolase [Hypoxylon trugodes]KAI1390218.1 alpha/beta-hydrolase [Hypoxylon trugodes]